VFPARAVILTSNVQTITIGENAVLTRGLDRKALDYSDQKFGPGEIMLVSCFVISPSITLTEINLANNPVARCTGWSIQELGATSVKVEEGVFVLVGPGERGGQVKDGGRWGQVTDDPDSDREVELTWLDDGTSGSYVNTCMIISAVAKSDMLFEYAGLDALFAALLATNISKLGVKNIGLDPTGLGKLAGLFASNPSIIPLELDLSGNHVTGVRLQYGDVVSGSVDCDLRGMSAFGQALHQSSVELCMEKCYLGREAVSMLEIHLPAMATLIQSWQWLEDDSQGSESDSDDSDDDDSEDYGSEDNDSEKEDSEDDDSEDADSE
jgi:hypothetical protein